MLARTKFTEIQDWQMRSLIISMSTRYILCGKRGVELIYSQTKFTHLFHDLKWDLVFQQRHLKMHYDLHLGSQSDTFLSLWFLWHLQLNMSADITSMSQWLQWLKSRMWLKMNSKEDVRFLLRNWIEPKFKRMGLMTGIRKLKESSWEPFSILILHCKFRQED